MSKKGYKHTEETRNKISRAVLGRKKSEEHKMKISIAMKKLRKTPMSDETRKKLSIALKEVRKNPISDETKKKMSEAHKGEKAYNWAGGVNSPKAQLRRRDVYILWRKACLERDSYTCQKTKESGIDLDVHHIKSYSEFPELRLVVENGITLSKKAHRLFHKIYGIRNNTREQMEEFLAE